MSHKVYAASELPDDEYIVLDCLAAATMDDEVPISVARFTEEYALLEDVADVVATLDKLREKRLAGQDLDGRWFATQPGLKTMQFAESTARMVADEQKADPDR